MSSFSSSDATALFRKAPAQHIDVGAGEAAYRVVGSGPDVLFVHGWPVSGATFRHLLPHLAEHLTCHVIDLPGAGDSRFGPDTPITLDQHVRTVRAVVDHLGLDDVALVGHDSGGMIARHAMAGDPRLRAFGLINTEQPQGLSFRFKLFLAPRNLPGFGAVLRWALGIRWLRRNPLLLGNTFVDADLIDGDFDDFFLRPLVDNPERLRAAMALLKTFDVRFVHTLGAVHQKVTVPVQLVWGAADPFFPLNWAREMVSTFHNARLDVIANASLFAHEEKPEAVAKSLLPVLIGTNRPHEEHAG
ncbi:MAG: alpha/beta hydrolase [Myxococcota bacterium]